MREIKFRGRNIYGWYYGDLLTPKGDEFTYIRYIDDDGDVVCAVVDPKTVGQITGLKDKGVEIFEGDIVGTGLTDENDAFVVGFNNAFGGYYIERPNDGWREFLFMELGNPHHNEVIGNIHENPELLK